MRVSSRAPLIPKPAAAASDPVVTCASESPLRSGAGVLKAVSSDSGWMCNKLGAERRAERGGRGLNRGDIDAYERVL